MKFLKDKSAADFSVKFVCKTKHMHLSHLNWLLDVILVLGELEHSIWLILVSTF